MPVFSQLIKPKPRWKTKVSSATPFSPARCDHISSPHPYASPDIVDIRENTASFGSVVDSSTAVTEEQPRLPTPNIRLDLDLTSDPFDTDWFQTQFTSSVPVSPSQWGGELRGDGIRPLGSENRGVGHSERWGPRGVPADDPSDGDDDVDISTSEDDILDHLKAMDASTFLNSPPQSHQVIDRYVSPAGKKTPPTPIRIPSLAMYGPQVQIIRSAEHNNSRPLSEVSSVESSAVSGQTLARALLGNSFVLSSDARSSRYRSGFGGLVRSDSATLPRGDHPLLNSPYWRDRSGTSDAFAADPNVPPIPSNADKVYVPPQTPRLSSVEAKKKNNIKRHSSAGSLTSPTSKLEFHDAKSRPSSVIDYSELDKDIQVVRRISRISENPSSSSSTPAKPEASLKASPGASPVVPEREEHPLPPLPLESPHRPSDTASNPRSPAASSEITASSTKELDNVLDYYSLSDTPESAAERAFAPAFSPIIEESSSQLSSPASRRLSHRPTPTGSRALSPLAGTTNGRIDLSSVRRPSDGAIISKSPSSTLLPIGERRRSIQMPPPSSSAAQHQAQGAGGTGSSGSASGQRTSLVPPPPLGRVVGGRLRSGSAPSPIKVDRDSRDLNAYKITVSPLHENSLETPSTGGSDGIGIQQTFPETPSAFSPFWSPGSNSPGLIQGLPEGYEVMPMPQTPMSATLPGQGRGALPSIDQQILTRAATMVRSRHSRQASASRFRTGSIGSRGPPKPQAPATSTQTDSTKSTQDQEAANSATKEGPQAARDPRTHVRTFSEDSAISSVSQYSEPSVEPHAAFGGVFSSVPPLEPRSEARQLDSPSRASSVQSSPRLEYLIGHEASPPEALSSPPIPPLPSSPPTHRLTSAVEFTDPFKSNFGSRLDHRSPRFSPHDHTIITPPVVITPPAGDPMSAYLNPSLRRISEFSHTLESPPPYDTIAQDHPPPASVTPGSGNSNVEPYFRAASSQHSPPAHHDSSSEYLPLSRKTSSGNRERRQRLRPTGPRRPSSHYNHATGGRARNASVSSLASVTQNTPTTNPTIGSPPMTNSNFSTINSPNPNFRLEPTPTSAGTTVVANSTSGAPSPGSPKFHIPAVRYRGLTMEQAKWTFTSSQLQSIVSRAIRQSAEASSIRLLRLETLDNDIPQELKRLETQKSEIKGKYRSLTRASESLFAKLNSQISNQSPGNVQRTAEELRDVTRQLNGLTEELHSVDQQQAQIQNLVQIHSASALSMALRKLNASFLKQLSRTQELQKQVAALEDEFWALNELRPTKGSPENQHAVQSQVQGQGQAAVAHESVPGCSTELERKRTHSVVSRRPSSRFSRPVRISGNHRLSQRSSLSSAGVRSSMIMSGMSGTTSTFSVPPVPPLPRRRPTDIVTDAPTRSATMNSTDGGTPNTEVRAMIRAQDELYHVLGVSLRGDGRLRRSHSVIGLPGNPEAQPHPSTTNNPMTTVSRAGSLESYLPSKRASGSNPRPVSYPSSLLDAYNHLDADRNAMLATLEMLSQDD